MSDSHSHFGMWKTFSTNAGLISAKKMYASGANGTFFGELSTMKAKY